MLLRIIFINIGMFVLLTILAVGAKLFQVNSDALITWAELPSDLSLLLRRPWTLVTYMFAHYGLFHILFNMLWLYWLGRIFMEFFSPKQLTGLYVLGGWGGALLFLLSTNLLPFFTSQSVPFHLYGASASVVAIVVAIAVFVPDYKIGLLFIGEVPVKWIAIVTVLISLIGLDGSNAGGNIAHIGGILVGVWYGLRIRQGHDITRPLNKLIDSIVALFNGCSMPRFNWHRKRRVTGTTAKGGAQQDKSSTQPSSVTEEELDRILKKIKDTGYDGLTEEERNKLFNVSRSNTP